MDLELAIDSSAHRGVCAHRGAPRPAVGRPSARLHRHRHPAVRGCVRLDLPRAGGRAGQAAGRGDPHPAAVRRCVDDPPRRLAWGRSRVGRLLVVGLLLTIALGAVMAGFLFPGVSAGVALLIGAALAPTDAALGQAVVTNTAVPARVRRILNVESGLNDGIATPFVFLAIALATAEGTAADQPGWLMPLPRPPWASRRASRRLLGWRVAAHRRRTPLDICDVEAAVRAGTRSRVLPGGRQRWWQRLHRRVRRRSGIRPRQPATRGGFRPVHRDPGVLARHRCLDGVRPHAGRKADDEPVGLACDLVRPPESHRHPHAAGRARPPGHGLRAQDRAVHRLVRTTRPGVGRVPGHRPRRSPALGRRHRAAQRSRRMDRAAVRRAARPERGAARCSIWSA